MFILDTWSLTLDIWHRYLTCYHLTPDAWYLTLDDWHAITYLTCFHMVLVHLIWCYDTWLDYYYTWHLISATGTWYVILDIWHLIYDTWHLTCFHMVLVHLTWYCDTWLDTIVLDACITLHIHDYHFYGDLAWILYCYQIFGTPVLLNLCIPEPLKRVTPDIILLILYSC